MRARPASRVAVLVAVVVAGLVAVLVAGCSGGSSGAFVTRSGASLELAGKPFHFVGFNLYDAAATDSYSCDPGHRLTDRELHAVLSYAHDRAGATVLRFWAYQTYTAGGTDFAGVDRVLSAARSVGMRAIPVLEDGPGDCTTGQRGIAKDALPGDDWYTRGYREPYASASLSFRAYAQVMAHHYRDDPTILCWMMMNEAETRARGADGRSALVGFARDVGSVIKAADPRHLLTLGTQGNGAPGTSGRDFSDIYALPVLDLAEVHDWAYYGSDTDPLPGSVDGRVPDPASAACTAGDARIACSFARAAALDKPVVVGEAGITALDAAARARRAHLLGAKITADVAAGADGYLVWHLSSAATDGYDVQTTTGDPLFDVLRSAAAHGG